MNETDVRDLQGPLSPTESARIRAALAVAPAFLAELAAIRPIGAMVLRCYGRIARILDGVEPDLATRPTPAERRRIRAVVAWILIECLDDSSPIARARRSLRPGKQRGRESFFDRWARAGHERGRPRRPRIATGELIYPVLDRGAGLADDLR